MPADDAPKDAAAERSMEKTSGEELPLVKSDRSENLKFGA
jgi:hypothetical protein